MKRNAIGIIADYDSGDASLRITPEFAQMSGLFRADVLQDAIQQLTELYHKSLIDMRVEYKNMAKERSLCK